MAHKTGKHISAGKKDAEMLFTVPGAHNARVVLAARLESGSRRDCSGQYAQRRIGSWYRIRTFSQNTWTTGRFRNVSGTFRRCFLTLYTRVYRFVFLYRQISLSFYNWNSRFYIMCRFRFSKAQFKSFIHVNENYVNNILLTTKYAFCR